MQRPKGFTLLELLVAMTIAVLLLILSLLWLVEARKKAQLTATKVYLRSVATNLEALRNPATGSLPQSVIDCAHNFGTPPSGLANCVISYPDASNYVIQATLAGSPPIRVAYDSATGTFTVEP